MTPLKKTATLLAATTAVFLAAGHTASAQQCTTMRKINIGVSVAPPNVVHTSPYVAKELGYFAKRCIDATICLLYTSPSPRDGLLSRMPSSA